MQYKSIRPLPVFVLLEVDAQVRVLAGFACAAAELGLFEEGAYALLVVLPYDVHRA